MCTPITVFGRTPFTTWLACVDRVLAEGALQRDGEEEILEIAPLIVHVDELGQLCDEDFPESIRDQLKIQVSRFCSFMPLTDNGWSYGQRLRADGTDQLADSIRRLKMKPESKAATAVTLRPGQEGSSIPCMVALDWKIRRSVLQVSAFFRSQDVYGKQLANFVAIAHLSAEVANGLNVPIGSLTAQISSAHIYSRDFDRARNIVHAYSLSMARERHSRFQVLVIGKEKDLSKSDPIHAHAMECAKEVGRLLAKRRISVLNGGLGGIMEATCAGVKDADGVSIGIVPEIPLEERAWRKVNSWQTAIVRTGLSDRERIPMLVQSADAIICISGGAGSRREALLGMERGMPVVAIEGTGGVADDLAAEFRRSNKETCFAARSANEAIEWVLRIADPALNEGEKR